MHTADLSSAALSDLRRLLDEVFGDDFSDDDFDHALGGIHVMAEDTEGRLIGHAAVVARRLHHAGRWRRVGYVEAVAVAPDAQRNGIGGLVMDDVAAIIVTGYEFGALSASDAGRSLYLRRGWVPWTGTLVALSVAGLEPTPDDRGSVMVWGLPDAPGQTLIADMRDGDPW
ncbi:GNAT family N-acetyltransferase [Williamsia sp. CHRR-6]|uniref:GNAT family N-acetyltransferase n=1 Tax=Williamsia sp. CHRR-6 TaxID=2835871 RepID=UPI001BD97C04|nr:GNAT family N-acetyltransferase [Williamsia sp. CHRR-6]MBT0565305.1 GNAT family N-acetyltransferase [Williamsia sp. CHRR-6]